MARIWTCGYESKTTTEGGYNVGGGQVTISTAKVRSGNASIKCVLSSGAERSNGHNFRSSDGNGPFFGRVYLLVETAPTGDNTIISFHNNSNVEIAFIKLKSDLTLQLHDEDGSIGSPSSALTLNLWYRVELKVDRTAAAGSHVVEAKLDDTTFGTSSARNLSTGVAKYVNGSNLLNEAQSTGAWYFDDIAINDNTGSFQNSYPGEGKVIHLRPNATGANGDWTGTFADIDEETPDDATSSIASNTLNQIEDVNIDPPGPWGIGTINCVQVGVRFRAAATPNVASFVLRARDAAGNVEESAAITPASTSWFFHGTAVPRNHALTLYDMPGASASAIKASDLDGFQIGARCSTGNTNNAEISTLWLCVDYVQRRRSSG